MLAGSILVFGSVGIRHGAGMRRGTIGLLGHQRPPLLPTFRYACRFRPLMFAILEHSLQRQAFPLSEGLGPLSCDLYHGDFVTGGRGEILIRSTSNSEVTAP